MLRCCLLLLLLGSVLGHFTYLTVVLGSLLLLLLCCCMKQGVVSKPGGLFGAAAPTGGQPQLSSAAEATIRRSLVVGNFEAAVQCCMSTGNMADAMILARCVINMNQMMATETWKNYARNMLFLCRRVYEYMYIYIYVAYDRTCQCRSEQIEIVGVYRNA